MNETTGVGTSPGPELQDDAKSYKFQMFAAAARQDIVPTEEIGRRFNGHVVYKCALHSRGPPEAAKTAKMSAGTARLREGRVRWQQWWATPGRGTGQTTA